MRMPSLFRNLLLGALIGLPWVASAAEDTDNLNQAVVPEVKRLDLHAPSFPSKDFEIGYVRGGYLMPYYYNSKIQGLRFNYHINEDFYLHLDYDETTVSSKNLRLLPDDCYVTGLNCDPISGTGARKWTATTVGLGLSGLLPGELYVLGKYAFLTSGYVFGGMGTVNFNGRSEKTITTGGGSKLYLTNWLILNFEARTYLYTISRGNTKGYYNPKDTYRKGVISGESLIGLSVVF
jgi:outer membrane beta-barrel protein